MISDDMALVQEYAQSNSEQAFATLVSRHVNLVYSVALRRVSDHHLAEEISQAVFVILARKGKSLSPKTILCGWLCRTARKVSADTLKIQRRRQFREQEAHMESILNEPQPGVWNQIAPLLDEALNCLGEKEHDAVVLRFLDGKELKQVGAAIGTTEDGARMRVNRGLEKLREFFTKKGATLSATAIAGAVAANSVQAAPAGLAASITAAALSGTAITTTAVIAATKAIAMTTLQKTVVAGVFVATVGAGFYEARHAARLRHEVQTLQQQQAPLAGQVEQLTRERDGATNKLAVMRDENERLNGNAVELLKLRGMVSTLRRELESQKTAAAKDLTNLTETSLAAHKPGSYISKAQLADAGFKTPEAALQTYFQAMLSGDYNHVVAAMSAQSGASNSDQREAFEKGFREDEEVSRFQGIQMLGKKVVADGRVDVGFLIYEEGKAPMLHVQQLVKEGGEWKAGNSQGVDSSWGEGGQIQPLTPPANQ